MSARILSAALVAALVIPAAASAADREFTLATPGEKVTWSSAIKTGFVYTSSVSSKVPACSPIFSCDATLIKTEEYGDLLVSIAGKGVQGQDTMKDVDVHVYVSNANGAKGTLLGEGVTEFADESLTFTDLPAGYYLVYVDWYLGAGSYDGTVTLNAPTTPDPEQPPVFEPAPDSYPKVTPARTHAFTGTTAFEWDGPPAGGLSDVQPVVGCHPVNCDYSLFQVAETGVLTVSTAGDVPTLIDADIHVYRSDAQGSVGPEEASATNFTPNETLPVFVEPGYYLMMVAYSGAGTYSGSAQWAPPAVDQG